jgi:hypothetical protein
MNLTYALDRVLKLNIALDGLRGEWQQRAENVARFRRYDDGEHDNKLSDAMRQMLRIGTRDDYTLSANYMPLVIDTLNNRLSVVGIEADAAAPEATQWAQVLLEAERFDRLQTTVHRAAIRDGDSFVFVWWDAKQQRVRLTLQEAFDGRVGVIPIYYTDADSTPGAVIKIWQETLSDDGRLTARVRLNVYTDSEIRRYIGKNLSANDLQPFSDDGVPAVQEWRDADGSPLGIPIIHFRNRPRGQWGVSEISSAIVLQDCLNRTLASLLLAAEKTAFTVRAAFGFEPPAQIGVGDWVVVAPGGLTKEQQARIETLDAGDVATLRETATFFKSEIATTTGTPTPEMFSSSSLSGEAFKQREATLVGKINAFQQHVGASWEMVLDTAWRVQAAFGEQPPDYSRFNTRWLPAQSLDEKQRIANAVAVRDSVSRRAFLRLVAAPLGLEQSDIDVILNEMREDEQASALASLSAVPDFRAFGLGGE